MEICASMTLQICQLIGVTEGLTISYPNFSKSYLEQICFFFTDMFLRYAFIVSTSRDGSRIVIGGGGGCKILCGCTPSQARSPKSLTARVQKLLGVLMASRVIWALLLSIMLQNGTKSIVDQVLGGACWPPPPPFKFATDIVSRSVLVYFLTVLLWKPCSSG